MGIITGGLNLIFLYKVIRKFITPFDKTEAFKLGIIDERGKILKKKSKLRGSKEKDAYTMMDRFVWKLKRLLEKIPFGKSRLASYAAALWFLKEEHNFSKYDDDEKLLEESFMSFLETEWEQDAQFLKEQLEKNMEAKSYTEFTAQYLTEEEELTELLKSKDKSVIDAFYKKDSLVGRVLSSTGKSLEKHGVGGQTIAAWLKGKIAITAVSDVKSTESILNYMKKSIPKNNFDPKSYKKFFEEVEVAEAKMSDPMIAKLKQKYEPLRGKRLSLGQNTEIAKIVSGMGKDKEVLLQLVKADIPFISLNAATFLMDKHGMKAKDINLGNKLVRKQEIKSKIIDDSYHGNFAGNDVFIVNSDTFHTCRLGKQKYHRYEKYVGNGKIGQAIREFGLTNPKKPIILQNGEDGPMLYLRYGGSQRYA